MLLAALGLAYIAIQSGESMTFPVLLLGLTLVGIGIGFATAQLANVVLSRNRSQSQRESGAAQR